MNRYQPRALVEAAFMTAFVTVVILLYYIVPFLGLILNFIIPVPMAIVSYRHGIRWGIVSWVAAVFVISLFTGPALALMEMLTFGATGLVLGLAHKEHWSDVKHLLIPSAVFIVGMVTTVAISQVFLGFDFVQTANQVLDQAMKNSLRLYQQMGMAPDQLAQTEVMFKAFQEQLWIIVPAYFVVMSVATVFIDNYFINLIFKRINLPQKPFSPAMRWEMPRVSLYFFVLSWILEYWGNQWNHPLMMAIGSNLRVITMMIFWVQGVAFLKYIVVSRRWRPAVFTVLVVASLLQPLLTSMLIGLGMMDLIMRFRQKRNYE